VKTRVIRLVLVSVMLAAVLTLLWFVAILYLRPPLPSPPKIAAASGPLPAGLIELEQRIARDGAYEHVGVGFLLRLPDENVIGVATAHSLGGRGFAPIHFTARGNAGIIASFSELFAHEGTPRTGSDLTGDYLLLWPDVPVDEAYVLEPDPRGAPQPGERVALYSGATLLDGTVESVDEQGAWIRLDRQLFVGGLSGSPVFSRHTGKVVGMVIAANPQPNFIRLGLNPIGVILQAASR
jgi:hypothetical protein